jgi:hypothetical protein
MAGNFNRFSKLFEQLNEMFPDHPFIPQIRSSIAGLRRPPSDKWLEEKIMRMEKILSPNWPENDNEEGTGRSESSAA